MFLSAGRHEMHSDCTTASSANPDNVALRLRLAVTDFVLIRVTAALAFLTAHPRRRDALAMVITANEIESGSSGASGLEQAIRFFPSRTGYLLPDWIVGATDGKQGGIEGAGFWTQDWQYSPSMSFLS